MARKRAPVRRPAKRSSGKATKGRPAEEPTEQGVSRALALSRRGVAWTAGIAGTALIGTVTTLLVTKADSTIGTPGQPVAIRLDDDPELLDGVSDTTLFFSLPANPRTPVPPLKTKPCQVGFRNWVFAAGGNDAGETRFRLEIQGLMDKAVQVSRASAKILARRAAGPTKELECPSAGEAPHRDLAIDLDADVPQARYEAGGHQKPFGFTLSKGETENFDLSVRTKSAQVIEWRLALDLTVNGKPFPIEVADHGHPFRTIATGVAGRRYVHRPGEAGWRDESTGKDVTTPFG